MASRKVEITDVTDVNTSDCASTSVSRVTLTDGFTLSTATDLVEASSAAQLPRDYETEQSSSSNIPLRTYKPFFNPDKIKKNKSGLVCQCHCKNAVIKARQFVVKNEGRMDNTANLDDDQIERSIIMSYRLNGLPRKEEEPDAKYYRRQRRRINEEVLNLASCQQCQYARHLAESQQRAASGR